MACFKFSPWVLPSVTTIFYFFNGRPHWWSLLREFIITIDSNQQPFCHKPTQFGLNRRQSLPLQVTLSEGPSRQAWGVRGGVSKRGFYLPTEWRKPIYKIYNKVLGPTIKFLAHKKQNLIQVLLTQHKQNHTEQSNWPNKEKTDLPNWTQKGTNIMTDQTTQKTKRGNTKNNYQINYKKTKWDKWTEV